MSHASAADIELAAEAEAGSERSPGYWEGVWRRIARDPVTLICLTILALILLAAIFAPFIAPHDPVHGSAAPARKEKRTVVGRGRHRR